ncbi:MAG TPA: hypothetical protein P5205_00935 [Candidatus Paceibacterota bacterium]|nr:hypothetical protein [Verrucomicrobiota bacterium]HSA08916.1 hypothetical protein [Candidatus Paceibacterota bacterium]
MQLIDNASKVANGSDSTWIGAFTPGRLAVLIALLLFALYPGVISGTHTFFYQDYGLFTYPVARYTKDSFWRGELPLWNPLNNCGVPFLAQWNTSVCYPLSLVYVLLPLPWGLSVFGLGHLVFAGVGMYLLAERWTQNRLAASIAGLAFGLNGLMLNCLLWTSNLAALSWQPWVILAVEQAWQRGGARRIALAALAGAMQMLSGAPEIIVFTWLILTVLWTRELLRHRVPVWPGLQRFAAVGILVAGLAAAQLLPFLDLLAHSERDASYGEADAWPMPPWGWANLIVPQFHASQSLCDTYHLAGQYWTKSYYVGVGVLVLGLVACWRVRQWRVRCLAGMALVGLVLALGHSGFLYTWLKQLVPALGFARYPIKFIALPLFAIPLLTACGLHALQNLPTGKSRQDVHFLIGASVLFLLVTAGILFFAHRFPVPEERWPVTCRDGVMRILFLAGLVGCLVGFLSSCRVRTRALLGATIVLLVGLDLITAGQRLHPTVDKRAFGPLELNMSYRPRLGESRALVSQQANAFLNRLGMTNPVAFCVTMRGALAQNNNLLENIPKVDGFCSLRLRQVSELMPALKDASLVRSPLADFLGVACVTAPDNVFAWQTRSGFLPLITAGQQPMFSTDQECLQAVTADDFKPREVVCMPAPAREFVRAAAVSNATIISPQWSASRVQFGVKTTAPAMVVIAQSFYHNWSASVDGQPARLWRGNYAYQALEVPAGRHEVTLVYRDRAFYLGSAFSALSLSICILLLLRRCPRGEGV